jgi:hypothetical protein
LADKNYPCNYIRDNAELASLKGLEISGVERVWFNDKPRFKLAIDNNTTKEQIRSFFETIPDNFETIFFDYFHPQLSDPGAYVTVQRYGKDFLYMLGNHGWSGEWKLIEKKDLAEYLFKNKEFNADHLCIYRLYKPARIGERH